MAGGSSAPPHGRTGWETPPATHPPPPPISRFDISEGRLGGEWTANPPPKDSGASACGAGKLGGPRANPRAAGASRAPPRTLQLHKLPVRDGQGRRGGHGTGLTSDHGGISADGEAKRNTGWARSRIQLTVRLPHPVLGAVAQLAEQLADR